MSEPFLGEIRICSFDFAPRGWAFCEGQLLQINQNQALYSLLGISYGGNGISTFALPDLRGRMPINFTNALPLGRSVGEEAHRLTIAEMPMHTHLIGAQSAVGTATQPANAVSAQSASRDQQYATIPNVAMAGAVAVAGSSQPHENRPPFLTLRFVIALTGIYPPRN